MSADLLIAIVGRSPRNWLHSADILIYHAPAEPVALVWLATVFGRYPGCAAAIARCPGRCLIAVRDEGSASWAG
ncbi:MAG TPA: hypothetical protein VG756_22730 [Pseudonocardiaceae bacterium]|jgi:hypothetical protein|nr:hypothetical protein [Pseudonocardiaceae bacterium]